jgi:beta-xylosidase
MVRSLVDTGSCQNIMSQRLYNRLFRSVSCSQDNAKTQDTDIALLSASASQMTIIATTDQCKKLNQFLTVCKGRHCIG